MAASLSRTPAPADDAVEPAEVEEPSEPLLLVDVLAPALVIYFVLTWRPFELFVQFPGFASSGVFPILSLGVLLITPTQRLARIPIPWALMAFMGWLVFSYTWTIVTFATAFLIRSQLPGLIMLSLLTATIPANRLARVLTTMFVVLGVFSLLACILVADARQVYLVEGSFQGVQSGFRGGFGHKNQLGIFSVFGLCTVLPFLRNRWRPAAIILFVVLILGTRSATAASGLFAVAFAWFWMAAIDQQTSAGTRRLLGLLSIASALGAILLAFGLLPSLLDLYQKDVTFSGRTFIWTESLVTIGQRPLQGYGYGAVWADGRNPVTADLRARIGFAVAHAHNGVIEILLQVGMIGLGLLVLFLTRIVRLGGSLLSRAEVAPFGQWGLLILLSLLLMQISEPLFDGGPLGMLVVVWTVLSRIRNDQRRAGVSEHHWATRL